MEDEALGGLGEGRCAARHLRAGRASKIGEILIGVKNQKRAGTGNEGKYRVIFGDFTV